MREIFIFGGRTKINDLYITRKLAKRFSQFLTAREKKTACSIIDQFFTYFGRDTPIHKSPPLSTGFQTRNRGGYSPPSLSRSCVKNRGVYCKLVLWLMRLSSSCWNRVQAQDLVLANISQRSFTSKILLGCVRWVPPRCKPNFFSCTFARKSRTLLTTASHALGKLSRVKL